MLDKFRETAITWDKATRRIHSPITANGSDSNGRKLNIQVVNSGQVENLTGATLHLYWETKDKTQHGLDAFTASDISKGEFELFYTTGMLSNVGELNATLVLVDSTGKVVSDWFKITVTRGINEDAIQSENSFTSLTQALIDISNLEQNYAPRLNDLTAQLQQTEQSLNAQLEQKAEQTDLLNKRDKSVPIGLNDAGDDLLLALQNKEGETTFNLESIPRDDSVTPEKIYDAKVNKNMFNKRTSTLDFYVNWNTGELTVNDTFFASDYIKVTPSTSYARQFSDVNSLVAYYTSNKVFISGTNLAGATFVTPPDAHYIRVSQLKTRIDTEQIELGSVSTSYEPYSYTLDQLEIKDGDISPDKLNFVTRGKNLFNKNTVRNGYYVDWNTGDLRVNDIFFVSDFIKVSPSTSYTRQFSDVNCIVAYYTSNKVFISGTNSAGATFVTPSDAHYIKVSQLKTRIDAEQIELGTVSTSYEPYGYIFNDSIIIPNSNGNAVMDIEINLPPVIHAIVGKEMNIYLDNVILGDYRDYLFDVTCSIGKQQHERWTVIPTSSGTHALTIDVYNKENTKVGSSTTSIIVKDASVGAGLTKKALFIGDSTTYQGYYTNELVTLFSDDAMDLTLLGTQGTSPNNHEGKSGWKASDFVSNVRGGTPPLNPFWNTATSKFDFSMYMTNNAYSDLNYVVINLGINDVFNYANDAQLNTQISVMLTQYQTMIDGIKAYDSNIKIGLAVTIPPNFSQDGFAVDYANGQTRWRYKRNNHLWVKALIGRFKNKETQGIYLVPTNVNLDTLNNMGSQSVAVNSRNTTTIIRATPSSGVHPDITGYLQIADAFYYWLKSFES